MTGRLNGAVAVVTGSSSGIGRATAQRFAEEGAQVILLDRQVESRLSTETPSTEELIRKGGTECRFIECDLGREQQVVDAFRAIAQQYGKIDVLVNSAAIFRRSAITSVTYQEWQQVLNVNLTGVFLTIREAIPLLLKGTIDSPSIVNIASVHAHLGTGDSASYCASKAGVENLSRQVAVEYATKSIRCNSIVPGTIETAMSEPFRNDPDILREYNYRTLLPRLGRPSDVASAALFLASAEASWITGSGLVVDGGWSAW